MSANKEEGGPGKVTIYSATKDKEDEEDDVIVKELDEAKALTTNHNSVSVVDANEGRARRGWCSGNPFLKCTKRSLLAVMALVLLVICSLPMLIAVGLSQQCSSGLESGTFSEFPGFKEYFAAYPPSDTLPTEEERAMLDRYRPRVFMEAGQTPFIDFYKDYISHGALYDRSNGSRRTVASSENGGAAVNRDLLNQYKDNPHAEFAYSMRSSPPSSSPVIYGRIDQDTLTYGNQSYPLTFLTYNIVFAHSGLIQGLDYWQKILMGLLVGDRSDWHQLDHYVGFSLALYQGRPMAVTLQQHNYQVTKLLVRPNNNATSTTDTDTGTNTDNNNNYNISTKDHGNNTMILPNDDRLMIDVALQSNEVYPHPLPMVGPTLHPALSFVTPENIEFFLTSQNKPLMAGYDMTHGQVEQDYELQFLPPSDAFYTFQGRLGERRQCLPGRDGPPGAMYVTLPTLTPHASRMVFGYMPGSVEEEGNKLGNLLDGFEINEEGLERYKEDFIRDAFGTT